MSDKICTEEVSETEQFALNVVSSITNRIIELRMKDQFDLCSSALKMNNSKHQAYDKQEKNVRRGSISENLVRNQYLRFGIGDGNIALQSSRPSWAFFGGISIDKEGDPRNYEEVLSHDILNAPICDICLVQSKSDVPYGYYRIYKTPDNKKADLNNANGGNPLYLCVKKDLSGKLPIISNFIVVFPDRNEYVPAGYYVVSLINTQNIPCNLNSGTKAGRVYLCYRKDNNGNGNPITDVQIIFQSKGLVSPPKAFHMIEKSISGIDANLNAGTSGSNVYFCYRQKMSRLNLLLIEADSEEVAVIQSKLKLRRNTLRSFDDSDMLSNLLKRKEIIEDLDNIERNRARSFVYDSSNKTSTNTLSDSTKAITSSSSNALQSLDCTFNELDLHSDDASSIQSASTESVTADKAKKSKGIVWEDQSSTISTPTSILPSPTNADMKNNATNTSVKSRVSFGGVTTEENVIIVSVPECQHESVSLDEGVFELESYKFLQQEFDDEFFQYDEEMSYLLAQQQQHKDKEVVDSHGITPPLICRKSLLAILASIYIRHGSISGSALAGLNDLLRDSDFFTPDLEKLPAASNTTMIDVAIEVVCDRIEVASDGERDSLLRFLGNLTKYAGSKLSLFSLQRIYRAISFLCSHYAYMFNSFGDEMSVYSGSTESNNHVKDKGVPAFKLFSKLLTDTFGAAEHELIPEFLPSVLQREESFYSLDQLQHDGHSSQSIVEDIVDSFISDILNALELSRLSEVAYITISKQSYSTVSVPFWKEVTALSNTFFTEHAYRSVFTLLSAICKQAWYTVRTKNDGISPVSRDVNGKLVALCALEQFCLLAGEKVRKSKILGYQIRRILIPCLMYNITFSFLDENIFRKILSIITALWTKWRWHIRIEFAIICEQFIFKIMQASVVQVRPIFKLIIINEVIQWFEQRQMLLEMFVNYDMDGKFVSQWNTFSYLVRTLCTISRRLTYSIATEKVRPSSQRDSFTEVSIRDVHMQALEEVLHMSKTLMDASGHSYLMLQDERFRDKSLSTAGGWTEDSPQNIENSIDSIENGGGGNSPTFKLGSIKVRRAVHQESEKLIEEAVKIYIAKNDLKKAVKFLIDKSFMGNTPQEIANFLRVYKNKFDSGAIGELLGEGGRNPTEEDYWSQIRFRYTRAVSFVEMDIEPALRLYLTGCGFRLPGEAQKINRFVEAFVKAFWQDNSGTVNCPFKQPDTAHMLAYAIIMLNTDLHRVNLEKKKKKGKMTKEEFTKNLRGIDEGNDVDKEYLSRIYDNIAAVAIELATGSTAMSSSANKTVDESMLQKGINPEVRIAEEKKFMTELTSSIRDSEDLLRSLAPFTFRFNMDNTDTKMSLDLVSFMYESVWFHFHATSESLLNATNCDINIKSTALEILQYSLTSAIFLDLKVERMTLAGLLNQFRETCEALPNASRAVKHPKIQDNSWYDDIESALRSATLDTISKLHHLIVYIKTILKENKNYELAKLISEKIEKKARIMEQNSYFVLEGDLNKLNRAGKSTIYHFFLFSDQLIYAHYSRNEYKVHEQLPLVSMKVTDVPLDPSQCSFYIDHPTKSFIVIAEDSQSRQQWLQALNQTIISCKANPLNNNIINNSSTKSSSLAYQNPIRQRSGTSLSPIRNRNEKIKTSKEV